MDPHILAAPLVPIMPPFQLENYIADGDEYGIADTVGFEADMQFWSRLSELVCDDLTAGAIPWAPKGYP
eukprot:gene1465-biopygen10927